MHRIYHSDVSVETLDILEEYVVAGGHASVSITADGRYLVNEPPLSGEAETMYDKIITKLHEIALLDTEGKSPAERERVIYDKFWHTGLTLYGRRELEGQFHSLKYYISRDLTGFGVLHPLMTDPNIEDILASAPARPVHVKHKKHSNRHHSLVTNVAFPDDESMVSFINRMFRPTGNEPTVAKPGAVTYLPDKSRISATVGNIISEPGSTIAIRKFPADPYVITHMINGNTLTAQMAAFLWSLLDARVAGFVIGTTGSGKTTLLGALTTMMHPRWRILTIEDSLELRIPHVDWVRYRTKKATGTVGAEHDVTISKLIDQSLTQKPDYEIVGEIRDVADARQLFQSMGTGHGGLCLPPNEMVPVRGGSTISYDTMRNVVDRFRDGETLQAYSMMGGRMEWQQITGTVVKRGPDDWRRITAGGAVATVHAGHPLITERGIVRAADIRHGDSVPAITGLCRDVATHLGRDGQSGVMRLDARSGRMLAAETPGDLWRFCLSGPEEFVRECGVPARYHAVSDGVTWEAVEAVECPSLGTALYDIEVRAAGNFTHGDGIVTHNTTFHANTPRGALTRLELGGVSHAELVLLGFIVYVTEVRVGGVVKRRVRNITEVTPGDDGKPHLLDLFEYDLEGDTFKPLKGLLETKQYREACFRNSVHDPEGDMARRVELLNECVSREAYTIQSVFQTLGRYYDR